MEYRNNTSGLVETRDEVLAKHKGWSFPKPITNTVIESLGYTTVFEGIKPSVTAPYGTTIRDGIEQISGKWYKRYKVGPIFTDTKDNSGNVVSTAAQNEAKYKKSVDDQAAAVARSKRDVKLHDTDWTQAVDTALANDKKAEWVTYRTSLRNLPAASGFPHSHTWPTEPS